MVHSVLSDAQIFNQIPHSHDAFPVQEESPVDHNVLVEICEVFRKHGQEERLKVVLNHRHFELEDGEKLVGRGLTSAPWLLNGAPAHISERVIGSTWAYIDGQLQPYEHSYVEGEGPVEQYSVPSACSDEVYSILKQHDLVDRLGISLYDEETDGRGAHLFETTLGRVNTLIKGDVEGKHILEVAWNWNGPGEIIQCAFCVRCAFG